MLNAWLLSPSRQHRDAMRLPGNGGHLIFLGPFNPDAVFAHKPADAAVANVQTQLFQFFRHSRTAVAAQAETRLFFDVSQDDHVRPLPLAGRSAAIGTQASFADI